MRRRDKVIALALGVLVVGLFWVTRWDTVYATGARADGRVGTVAIVQQHRWTGSARACAVDDGRWECKRLPEGGVW